MRKRFEGFVWENLDDSTWRVKVIGGWLVAHQTLGQSGNACSESMVFILDRDHEWHIMPPKPEPEPEKDELLDAICM